jgi:phosphoglycerate dehydrogenase-like enzyme
MRAIFLTDNLDKVGSVFSGSVLRELMEEAGLGPTSFLTSADLPRRRSDLEATEYVFSTWNMPPLSETQINSVLPNLRAVFYAAGSVKYFAEPFLNCGVRVFSSASANAIPVAEFVVAQTILANKGFFKAQRAYKRLRFREARRIAALHPGNFDCDVGIIGAGLVGTKVIELLRSHSVRVLVHDPYLDDDRATALGCTKVTLATLFKTCEVISNHLPDNESTRGTLNYDLFRTMKPTVTFINTGRGAQVNEAALIRALKEKPDACALLDVTGREPLWPHSPFYRMRNVYVTPHIAGSSGNEERRLAQYMLEAFRRFRADIPCEFEITRTMLASMA